MKFVEKLCKPLFSCRIFSLCIIHFRVKSTIDIHTIMVKTKVSGCFRTEKGGKDYLKIMSYVGTAQKQGYNAEAIKNAITGHPELFLLVIYSFFFFLLFMIILKCILQIGRSIYIHINSTKHNNTFIQNKILLLVFNKAAK